MVDVKSRRVFLVFCSSLILSFAFWRCSPIAPSIPKSALRDHEGPEVSYGAAQRSVLPAVKVLRVNSHFSNKVIPDLGIRLTQMEVESLRLTNRATIEIDSSQVSNPTAVIKLSDGNNVSVNALAALSLNLSLYSNGSVVLSAHDPEAVLSLMEDATFLPNGDSLNLNSFDDGEKTVEPTPEPPLPLPSPSPSSS